MSAKQFDVPTTGEVLDEQGLNVQVAAFKSLIGKILRANYSDNMSASLASIARMTKSAIMLLARNNQIPNHIYRAAVTDVEFIKHTRLEALKYLMDISLRLPHTRKDFADFVTVLDANKALLNITSDELVNILDQLIAYLIQMATDFVLPEYITEMSQFLEGMKLKLQEA